MIAHLRRTVPCVIMLAFLWVALCIFAATFSNWLAPHFYQTMDLRHRLAPPVFMGGTWDHVLGTDEVGHDVFSQLLASLRVSLLVALAASIFGSTLGTTLGFLAAQLRGWFDDALMMLVDAQAAIPFIIVALTVIAGASSGSTTLRRLSQPEAPSTSAASQSSSGIA